MPQPTHKSFLETFILNSYRFDRINDDPQAFAQAAGEMTEPWRSRFLSLSSMARGEFEQATELLVNAEKDDQYARLLRLRALKAQNRNEDALPELTKWWNSPPEDLTGKDLWAATGLLFSYALSDTEKLAEALKVCEQLHALPGPDLVVAKALVNKGVSF